MSDSAVLRVQGGECLRINVPPVHLNSGHRGIEALLVALTNAWSTPVPVALDFSACGFISGEAVILLAALARHRLVHGLATSLDWDTVQPKLVKQFGRWQVGELFGASPYPWTDNAIPLLCCPSRNVAAELDWIQRWIISHRCMPVLPPDVEKRTRRGFCELIDNAFRHAESPAGCLAMGQVYRNVKRYQLCVCDTGLGIVAKVRGAGFATEHGPDVAIAWSLKNGTTTVTDRPGGTGLYDLHRFIKGCGGSIRIYANDGFYEQGVASPRGLSLKAALPGTLIEFRLPVGQA